jgi:ApbE superfamily uncharacterized protein (UPF0280 family)
MTPIDSAIPGLRAADRCFDLAADRVARAAGPAGDGGDSVSLSDAAVGLVAAKDAYETDVAAMRVANEMWKQLVDILG